MNESQVLQILRSKRYADPEYAFISHVNEATGAARGRTIDAVAMGLWPSRGLHLHGIEVKVHRSDWLRELKKPAKADGWACSCHFFWVAAPVGVVSPEELPPGWGLLHVTSQKVAVITPAQERRPEPLSLQRLAGLLRAACRVGDEVVPRQELQAMAAAELERLKGQLDEQHQRAQDSALAHYRSLAAAAARFAEVSGISLVGLKDTELLLAATAMRGSTSIRETKWQAKEIRERSKRIAAWADEILSEVDECERGGGRYMRALVAEMRSRAAPGNSYEEAATLVQRFMENGAYAEELALTWADKPKAGG